MLKVRALLTSEWRGHVERLISASQAAELLGVSETTIYRLTARREIPHVKIGRRNVFRPADLEKWVAERTVST